MNRKMNKNNKTRQYENQKRKSGKSFAEKSSYKKHSGKGHQEKKLDGKSEKKQLMTKKEDTACPVYKKCGSCQYLHLSYEKYLKERHRYMKKLLGGFGEVRPIMGMENPQYYRNKVHAAFGYLRNGTPISGIYEENTHKIVSVTKCLIENEKADEIINTIRELLKSFKIKIYDEDTGRGLLRHVLIRVGEKSGQIMVVLVLSSIILPSKNNFVKALRKIHPEISTIVINVNDKKTSMVLGDKEQVIYGKGYIEDVLCDYTFRISPKSFYQVNAKQTEVLYKEAVRLADLHGTETIVDAYCGIGTIGIVASSKVKQVIGVELNPDAVRDAKINARRNEVKNISFYTNDAGKFMVQMAEQQEKVDVVFMDPPRGGSDEVFMDSVIRLAPDKVVYISCGPESLARDLKYMIKYGYEVKVIQPVDMFPWTESLETVVLLSYKN